ncbi:NAD(P)-dependent alcohol dehydrogenase [Microbacterium sp. bgisy207]|jgi:NADPH:quinone reductase-like Zn-dependent oxidoreductase|uniref:NAD(P)-dependent alcohol dehydrogenase n=1 Tax=Microbacterium sp. bgisy207 TaxID=3413800 RepID=UPI003EBADD93
MNDNESDADSPKAAPTTTMAAWLQHRYGGPEVVESDRLPVPAPGPTDLLVRVRACGIHAGDARLMRGDPYLVRLAFGIRRPRAAVRGMDVAGTVVAVGSGVTDYRPGDEVVAEIGVGGGLAEYAIMPAARAVARPDHVPAQLAAALPVSGGTAVQALDAASVGSGSRVLVIGAAGGVGTFAVQLAAQRGADVWALAGERALDLVTELGAAHVFDYRRVQPGSPELPAASFDAVIDIAGTAPLSVLRGLLREGGTVVLVSGSGGRVLGPMGRMLKAAFLSRRRRRIRSLAATAKPEVVAQLLELTGQGSIRPVIEQTYSFAAARDALAHVDAGHTVGKVVVTVE